MAGGAIDFLRDARWLDGRRVRGYAVLVGIASAGLLIVSWFEARASSNHALIRPKTPSRRVDP